MTTTNIREVAGKKDWDEFIGMAWKIYAGDPNWVPPLRIAVRDILDVRKNPFFKHAYMLPLMAMRKNADGTEECVGRVVGVIDENHNRVQGEKTAFFGFFEAIDDQKVVDQMMEAVAKWARSHGMQNLRGPVSPSTNHECGLLVDGFQDPPTVMMTYNPPYYAKVLEKWGFAKTKDLFAYNVQNRANNTKFSDRLTAQAERLKRRTRFTFRPVNMKKFDSEVEKILEVYNDAWEHNWGFVPMNREEFFHMAKDMKAIVDPNFLLIAEIDGKMAGFGLALPDANQAIHKISDGKLFPTGLVKLLWHMKGPFRKKVVNRLRIITLGIKKEYMPLGLGALFYHEYYTRAAQYGYGYGEASWILEDNKPMNRAIELMGGERTKVYRIYDKALQA